jgi:hypothetical protein
MQFGAACVLYMQIFLSKFPCSSTESDSVMIYYYSTIYVHVLYKPAGKCYYRLRSTTPFFYLVDIMHGVPLWQSLTPEQVYSPFLWGVENTITSA